MDVFDLVAKISLDQSEYNQALGDAGKTLEGFGGKLKKGLGTAAKIGGAALATLGAAGVALTKTILDGASKTAQYGDNIDKMSQKMGISAKAYQEWDAILQHSGSSIDSMQRGMMTLSNAVVKGSDAFQKLGLSQEEVASMSQEDLFAAVIAGLQGMEEGAERTALAQELLGGAAKELGPLLNTSAEDTELMRQRVNELGGVMSDEAVKAAAAYQDSLQDMQTAFTGLSRNLFTEFMPSIRTVMDGLTAIFTGDSNTGLAMISEGINKIVSDITDKLPEFIDIGLEIIGALGQAIIDNLPEILGAAGKIIGMIIAGIVKALPQLIKKAPEIIAAVIKGLKEAWPSIKESGTTLIQMLWAGVQAAAGALVSGVSNILDNISSAANAAWQTLKTHTINSWNNIKTSVSNAVNSLKTSIGSAWDGIKTTVSNAIDKIKSLMNFSWSLPKPKIPKFKISGGEAPWGFGGMGSFPEIKIVWNAKAYDNPFMFTKPTLYGFGDGAGGEIVYGRDNLMRDIREAVKGAGQMVINQYIQAVAQTPVEFASATEAYFEQARWAI